MKIRDLMTRDVRVARPEDTIQSIAADLERLDVGSMPVCDGQRLQGMITDRDIAIRAVAKGRGPDTTASQVMTPDVKYCFEDDDVAEVCDKMGEEQIRRIPVVDRDKNLVGIVALGDLALQARDKATGHTLEEISEPNRAH